MPATPPARAAELVTGAPAPSTPCRSTPPSPGATAAWDAAEPAARGVMPYARRPTTAASAPDSRTPAPCATALAAPVAGAAVLAAASGAAAAVSILRFGVLGPPPLPTRAPSGLGRESAAPRAAPRPSPSAASAAAPARPLPGSVKLASETVRHVQGSPRTRALTRACTAAERHTCAQAEFHMPDAGRCMRAGWLCWHACRRILPHPGVRVWG